MEKSTERRLLDAGFTTIADVGVRGATLRAIEAASGVSHGTLRHHFGGRAGFFEALIADLIADDMAHLDETPDEALDRNLGPGRTRSIARYELFLLAIREPRLREHVVAARQQLVQHAESLGLDSTQARVAVAALDGMILDALLRGDRGGDPQVLALGQALIPADTTTRQR